MKNFIERNKNKVFRFWHRKRMWTPYEMDKKDPDQSDLLFEECCYGYFIEAIDLGHDWLIGISEDENNTKYVSYYKLSELDFALSESDQED